MCSSNGIVRLHELFAYVQAAMNYSESQKQDILHLRRLFYGKLGQLSRARAAIMDQMPAAVQPSPVPPFNLDIKSTANKLAETQDWADQLCANRAEESRAYLFCTICLSRGVSLVTFSVSDLSCSRFVSIDRLAVV